MGLGLYGWGLRLGLWGQGYGVGAGWRGPGFKVLVLGLGVLGQMLRL